MNGIGLDADLGIVFIVFFIDLKLELLTQFPVSNDEKELFF